MAMVSDALIMNLGSGFMNVRVEISERCWLIYLATLHQKESGLMAISTPAGVVLDLEGLGGANRTSKDSAKRRMKQLFHIPVLVQTGVDEGESSLLLSENKKKDDDRTCAQCDTVGRVSWAVCPLVTTLLIAAILGVVVVVFMRIDRGIRIIDENIGITETTTSMLKNVNSIINSSASLAKTADSLGLKAIDLTYVLGPFAQRMMNSTEHIVSQVDKLSSNPVINIG